MGWSKVQYWNAPLFYPGVKELNFLMSFYEVKLGCSDELMNLESRHVT